MLLIYCLHGDEVVTEEVALKVSKKKPEVNILLGNLKARKKQVRYIETDLNRSFGIGQESMESKRAEDLKEQLNSSSHKLIIDLHTTKAEMSPCVIVTDLNQLNLAGKIGIERVIYMTPEFSSGASLIENIENSISLEFHPDKESKTTVCNKILQIQPNKNVITAFEVYFLKEIVKGAFDPKIKNFQELSDGTYPVFSGEPAYKGVKYLKTQKKKIKLSDLKAM